MLLSSTFFLPVEKNLINHHFTFGQRTTFQRSVAKKKNCLNEPSRKTDLFRIYNPFFDCILLVDSLKTHRIDRAGDFRNIIEIA